MLAVSPSPTHADTFALSSPERDTQYPASLGQQRFWVLDRLDPGNPSLNVAIRWRLEGELPVAHIDKAFEQILARHETLRTSFVEADGEPIQVVQPVASLRIPSIDLTAMPEAEAAAECDRIAQSEAQTPFNLAIAPLIRVTHVQVRNDVAILLVTSHHTVCDGWSIGLLAQELGEICEALQSGRAPVLPEIPITYGEFSRWQREFIESGRLAGDVEFWSRTLEGMGYFELQTDYPRRSAQKSEGSIRSLLLERDLTDTLGQVARRQGCTLFMVALAGLLTLLHRYTGAADIVLGTQVAGRGYFEVEDLVGLFINTLVLRTDLSGDPKFAELMVRARDVVADALEHEAMPLEKVIETLKPKRYPGYNAVFSVNFIFQRSFIKNVDHGKFKLVDLPSYSAGAMYDLNFFMVERPEGWRASCEFNTSLYEEETIGRLLRHFRNILSAVAANPSLRISDVPVLDEQERYHLLFECNKTATNYPRHLSLIQLFSEQVARTPAAMAVVDGNHALSYKEIEWKSNALAAKLLRRGIGPGARVGVFIKRSADLVIAPLAIMKSGNAYVPLDPAYPVGRLTQIVEQSNLSGIVAQSSALPSQLSAAVPVVTIDDGSGRDDESDPVTLPPILPDDAAYVIFTSGSTGRPKGAQIPHRALTNFVWSMRQKPGFSAQDTIVAVTTLCFDIAALELFLPLTVGAKVVIAGEDETRDGRLLLSLLKRSRARALQATPATWRMIIDAGWQGDPQLRMLCGGEALPWELADQLLARSPELWNMYGPTETTIWSAVQRINVDDELVTVGPPIANTQFYVVDRHDEPVPQGGIGELLIGGDGVATGYWGMPETTRERFVPDKFRKLPGERLYRTGDVVRMRRNGTLQFLGRADDQVKVRGFRIELGEIEATLLRHQNVRHAVAIAGEGPSRETSIYAYVEPTSGKTVQHDQFVRELRVQLAQTLPGYMRPTAIIVIDAIPRLPNGKVDRSALPRSRLGEPLTQTRLQPSNEVEKRLAEIWCSVLGLETIDGTADFFDLGGHSLLGARLLARVETVFGRRISLPALFNSPSFTAFAKLVQSSDHREFDFRQIVRLQPRSTKRGIFAINNTGLFGALSRRLGENLPVTGLQLFDPTLASEPLPDSLEAVAGRYAKLVRQLQPRGPYALLAFCNSGVLAFETARQIYEIDGSMVRIIAIDTWMPDYVASLGWPLSMLAVCSYRWKAISADWADVRAGRMSLRSFLFDRGPLREIRRRRRVAVSEQDPDYAHAEGYDRWLTEYMDQLVKAYRPRPMACCMTIVRSSREPAGLFLDQKLGWGSFATAGVDLVTIPGDHFSVFREPGVSIMARHIDDAVQIDFGGKGPGQAAAVLGEP